MTQPPRVFDTKIPLPALISGLVSVGVFMVWMGWQAAVQSGKMEALIQSQAKLELRLNDRDVRIEGLRDMLFELRNSTNMMGLRVNALEQRK